MPNEWVSKEVRDTCYKNKGTFDAKGNPRTIVHHIDFNHDNNDPENLIWLSASEHNSLHAFNRSEETIAKKSASLRKTFSRPEIKAKRSKAQKESMNRPEMKAKMSAIMNSQEIHDKISKSVTKALSKPEVKLKISKATKGKHWFNNGKVNKRAFECPEGFVAGWLSNKRKREVE